MSLDVFLGRVHGGAQIVPEKNRESSPLSKDVFWCCLRMILLAEYLGVLLDQLQTPRPCSEASVQTLSHKAGFIVPIDGKDSTETPKTHVWRRLLNSAVEAMTNHPLHERIRKRTNKKEDEEGKAMFFFVFFFRTRSK